MEHADRFLRRFYIEKGMFGSLSLTFIFYRPPLSVGSRAVFLLVSFAGTFLRIQKTRGPTKEAHAGE